MLNFAHMIVLGLLRERKNPPDVRVALTPVQCVSAQKRFPGLKIVVESSSERTFSDEQYAAAGIEVWPTLDNCDILMGIKEVPKETLLENKTYFFFSHTIKKQPHNQEMFHEIIRKKITLVDYEMLRWENGKRLLGFGRFAGIVGTYNGFLTWGKKFGAFELKPAWQCSDYSELQRETTKIKIPPIKITLTGGGRVAMGALEMLRNLNIDEVTPEDFLGRSFSKPVFVHLDSHELYSRKDGQPWDTQHFYKHHTDYKGNFRPFCKVTDMIINGIYWTQDLPRLFEKTDINHPEFAIKVIADISCDIEGSVPITIKDTKIKDPVFGWDKQNQCETAPFLYETIDVMAVGNLPNELPKDASEEFGENLIGYVLPELFEKNSAILERATLTKNGNLTPAFDYLSDY